MHKYITNHVHTLGRPAPSNWLRISGLMWMESNEVTINI